MEQFPIVGNYFLSRDGTPKLFDLFRGPLLQAPTFQVKKVAELC
jgi:hypothetical protein